MKIVDFILRFLLCTFTLHKAGDKVQAHRAYNIYSCTRCNNLFGVKKDKYK